MFLWFQEDEAQASCECLAAIPIDTSRLAGLIFSKLRLCSHLAIATAKVTLQTIGSC